MYTSNIRMVKLHDDDRISGVAAIFNHCSLVFTRWQPDSSHRCEDVFII